MPPPLGFHVHRVGKEEERVGTESEIRRERKEKKNNEADVQITEETARVNRRGGGGHERLHFLFLWSMCFLVSALCPTACGVGDLR